MLNEHMTTREAGKLLGLSTERVRQLVDAGKLPVLKVGRYRFVKRTHVETLKRRRDKAQAALERVSA